MLETFRAFVGFSVGIECLPQYELSNKVITATSIIKLLEDEEGNGWASFVKFDPESRTITVGEGHGKAIIIPVTPSSGNAITMSDLAAFSARLSDDTIAVSRFDFSKEGNVLLGFEKE